MPTESKSAATNAPSEDAEARAIRRNLGLGRSRAWRHVGTVLTVAALGVGGYFLYQYLNQPEPPTAWTTATLDRGDISTIVSATGTVEPLRVVEVGPEISGRITEVLVAENDRVTKGQVLARFDTEPLMARLEQARANLDVATARLAEVRATLREAGQNQKRAKTLREGGVNAERETESATAALSRARASLAQAEAQERAARAQVTQVETDLARAVLYSPIDGVVLTRAVEPGKAVASSLQTPVLFTLAEDLTRMELRLAIDEADVAQVKAGMPAEFTVDAYPKRTFPATVAKVHLAPTVAQNLVSYEAILAVDNTDLLLFPGMTATANITSSTVNNVLRVPNAALRFSPPRPRTGASGGPPGMFPGMGGRSGGSGGRPAGAGGAGGSGGAPTNGGAEGRGEPRARVYILENGQPKRVAVTVGATDGRFTEIAAGELDVGSVVLTGVDPTGGTATSGAPGSNGTSGNNTNGGRRRPDGDRRDGDTRAPTGEKSPDAGRKSPNADGADKGSVPGTEQGNKPATPTPTPNAGGENPPSGGR